MSRPCDCPRESGFEPSRAAGFAMLAALLVAAVALVFAGVALAAALGTIGVTAADGAHERARASAEAGVDLGLHRLSWVIVPGDAALSCSTEGDEGPPVEVTLETVEAIKLGWPVAEPLVRVTGKASRGRATARAIALVALRPTALPRGLSVAEDAELHAAVDVSGGGLYVGGSLRGREHASFAADADGVPEVPAPDDAWGGRWPTAGAHAGGAIWAAGIDIHDLDPVPVAYANDTDTHSASPAGSWDGPDLAAMVALPDAVWLASARAHALDSADALRDGVLQLDRLPPMLPTGEPGSGEVAGAADQAAGYIVSVAVRDLPAGADGSSPDRLLVSGVRDPSCAPVTVVVEGDACLGDPLSEPPAPYGVAAASLRGALVVTGHLEVAVPSSVTGHVACRRLLVAAPLALRLVSDWRDRPPVGSLEPLLLARE